MHYQPEVQEINCNNTGSHYFLALGFETRQDTGPEKNAINSKEHTKPGEDPVLGRDHHKAGIDNGQIDQCSCILASLFQILPQYNGKNWWNSSQPKPQHVSAQVCLGKRRLIIGIPAVGRNQEVD